MPATTTERKTTVSRTNVSTSTNAITQRRRVDHRVEVVDVLRGRAADEHLAHRFPRTPPGTISSAGRGQLRRLSPDAGSPRAATGSTATSPSARASDLPVAEAGVVGELRCERRRVPPARGASRRRSRRRSPRGRSSRPGKSRSSARKPCFETKRSGSARHAARSDVQAEDRRAASEEHRRREREAEPRPPEHARTIAPQKRPSGCRRRERAPRRTECAARRRGLRAARAARAEASARPRPRRSRRGSRRRRGCA